MSCPTCYGTALGYFTPNLSSAQALVFEELTLALRHANQFYPSPYSQDGSSYNNVAEQRAVFNVPNDPQYTMRIFASTIGGPQGECRGELGFRQTQDEADSVARMSKKLEDFDKAMTSQDKNVS